MTQVGAKMGGGRLAWQHVSGLSSITNYSIAGQIGSTAGVAITPTTNELTAIPWLAPEGGALVDQLAFNVTQAEAAVNGRVGIYTNSALGNLYPSVLLHDSGNISLAGTGVKTTSLSLRVDGGRLYWLVYATNSTSVQLRGVPLAAQWPIFGLDTGLGTVAGTRLVGTVAFAALANPFTAAVPVNTTAVGYPTLALRLAAVGN